jgi:regulator of nucleoside diphosphate kinase
MRKRSIFITSFDLKRLQNLLSDMDGSVDVMEDNLEGLKKELSRAVQVAPKEVPPDVITMNSTVRLEDCDTGESMVYTLVFPQESRIEENKISVLAPIGTAMLGYRVGDVFEWNVPAGKRRIRIREVLYQPEAWGDFYR